MKLLSTLMALGLSAGASLFAQDATAPEVVSSASLDRVTVGVCFNEPVDPLTANDPGNYTLAGGLNVYAAELMADQVTVLLNVDEITGGTFSLTVNGVTDLAGNAASATVSGTVLGLVAQDLGFVETPGKAVSCAPGSIDVYARGTDIWGTADSGHFAYEEKTGDFDVRVRLENFTAPALSANAGLMARESTAEGSRNVQIVTYSNQRLWVGAERPDTDGISRVLSGNWSVNWPEASAYPNIWLRLKRIGETFTTYGSTNGVDWLQVGDSLTPPIPYPETVLVGVRTTPVEVQAPGSTAVAKYREYGNFAITNATITVEQQPVNTTIRENTSATFTVNATVDGTPASNLNYQWLRNGEIIPNATGSSYTTPPLTQAENSAKYKVRISLPGGVVVVESDEAGVTVVQDEVAPIIDSVSSLDGLTVGVRFDETLDSATATDPSNYTISGATVDSATLEEDGRTVTLGVSGLSGSTFTVAVNGVTDLVGNVATANANGSVMGLTPMDIGIVESPGRAVSYLPGGVDVWARGVDIWGTADSGHFAWKEQSGNFDMRVRVEKLQGPAPDANGGLMVREGLDAGSRNIGVVVYANAKNWTAVQRVEPDGASSVLGGNWRIDWPEGISYPNVWLRLKRVGNTFTTYGSTDGEAWTQIGDSVTPEIPYPETIYFGLRTTPVEVEVPGSTVYAQYRDFGPFVLDNVSINITGQPASATVLENLPVSFSVKAEAVNTPSSNLSYQWLRNDEEISGANAPTYSIPSATSGDNGAKFRVRITLPGGFTLLSDEATLTVTEDVAPPTIISAGGLNGDTIAIQFSEPLGIDSANDPGHYTVDGADVYGASLQADGITVVLNVSGLTGSSFNLNVNGVADLEGNAVNASVTGQVSPLQAADLGIVPEPGFAYSTAPGSYDVAARGVDIWGTADSGHFIWEERSGDFDVRVRVADFTAPATSANVGLMAREGLDAGSRNFQIVTYANQQIWVSAERPETDGASRVTAGSWNIPWPEGAAYPNIWLRLKRSGDTFTVYGGTNGVDWIQVGDSVTPAVPFAQNLLVGMRTTPVEVQAPGSTGYAKYRDYSDVVEVTIPELSIILASGSQVTIAWPADASAGFALESTDALGNDWTEVTATPAQQGNQLAVTLPVETAGNRFFRLKR